MTADAGVVPVGDVERAVGSDADVRRAKPAVAAARDVDDRGPVAGAVHLDRIGADDAVARLAVDRAHQHKGLGRALLKDVLLRTAQAADIAGIRRLLVHAKDDTARRWYESWEFEPSPTDPYHLFLMLKDLKNLL